MKRALLPLLVLLVTSANAQVNSRPVWTHENVAGLSLSLEDPVNVFDLLFLENGGLFITVGRKDGPLTAPAGPEWKIVEGRLQLGQGIDAEQFTLVSRNASTIVVTNRVGKTLKFKIKAY